MHYFKARFRVGVDINKTQRNAQACVVELSWMLVKDWLKLFFFSLHRKIILVTVEPLINYFNDVLTTFLGLGSCIAVYAGSESSQI